VAELTGKVALITGGANGIGRATAMLFAAHGADLALCDVQQSALEETVASLQALGRRAVPLLADISQEEDVQRALQETVTHLGRLDILVNNASVVGPVAPVQALTLGDWERTLRVNLTGAMLCCREALRPMIAQRSGVILNVSSNVGRRGFPNRAPYVCSKWALQGLTQTLALEVAEYGVRVNAICPGPVPTERLQGALERMARARGVTPQVIRDEWVQASPMRRFATEDECAQVALFLVSDAASALTGQALDVSAGMMMT